MVADENGFEVKVYTHGTASTKKGDAAYAYMALNPEGRIVDMGAGYIAAVRSPLEADLGAIEAALTRMKDLGYQAIAVTTDAILAEQVLNERMGSKSLNVGAVVARIQEAKKHFDLVAFTKPLRSKGLEKKIEEMEESVLPLE